MNRNIIGKQYGYRSSALRAIRRWRIRYFAVMTNKFQYIVNRIDEGCYEIEIVPRGTIENKT